MGLMVYLVFVKALVESLPETLHNLSPSGFVQSSVKPETIG